MPKKCIKFIPEYLIPNLNSKRFGERLRWIDKSKNMFEIDWCHKAGPLWTEQEAAVFVEWDKHKGHFRPGDKEYYTKSKQRFRALLYKLTKEGQLNKMDSPTKSKKVFCIGQNINRRKKRNLNAENESFNEEETSSEQEFESNDGIVTRKVSENEAENVLGDHDYSSTSDSVEEHFTENERVTSSSFQDNLIPIPFRESYDNFQKRVLTERNDENVNTMMSISNVNYYTDNISSFDDLGNETANTNVTMLAAGKLPMNIYLPANQNTTLSENIFMDIFNSFQPPSMEFFDSL